jgi:chromosome partitioning protein
VAAQLAGKVTAIVDLDPQAMASNWSDHREAESPVVVSAQPARLPHVLTSAETSGAAIVLIDTPPRAEQAALAAAKAAHLILIPCRPAIYDLETVATTLELVRFAGDKPVVAMLNGVPPRGSKKDQAEEVIRQLGLPVCLAVFGGRTTFSDAGVLGLTAQEYDPGSQSAIETEEVYKFVRKLINSPTNKGVRNNGTEGRRLAQRHAGERESRSPAAGRVPGICGQCFETSLDPSASCQSAGHQYARPAVNPWSKPLNLYLNARQPLNSMLINRDHFLNRLRLWPRWHSIEQRLFERPHVIGSARRQRRCTRSPHLGQAMDWN